MKDLMTDDRLTEKLTALGKKVLAMVVEEVDHADEAEFILSFCRDFVLAHMAKEDHGDNWLRQEKEELSKPLFGPFGPQ